MLVFVVWIPLTMFVVVVVVWPFVSDPPSFATSEISWEISRVMISLSPMIGVRLKVTPILRYSRLALVVWLKPEVVTREPVKGMLLPEKIFAFWLSCATIF